MPCDTWDDLEGEDDGLEREWVSRRDNFYNSGYREGLEAGKHETVQAGFNAGYAAGARAGYAWGAACGAAASLAGPESKLAAVGAKERDTEALRATTAVPLREAAEAVVEHAMREHARTATQQPGFSHSEQGPGTTAAAAAGGDRQPLSYKDLQDRQQHVVRLLQQQGIRLELERSQIGSKPTP